MQRSPGQRLYRATSLQEQCVNLKRKEKGEKKEKKRVTAYVRLNLCCNSTMLYVSSFLLPFGERTKWFGLIAMLLGKLVNLLKN